MQNNLSAQQNIINAFIDKWVSSLLAKSILLIKRSEFRVFSEIDSLNVNIVKSSEDIKGSPTFDLIIGDLPIGMGIMEYDFHGTKLKIPRNWKEILDSLKFLEENGTAIYVIEPLGFGSIHGIQMMKELNKYGFYESAIIKLPEGICLPQTSIIPIFTVIIKRDAPSLFAAELLSESQAVRVADDYLTFITSGESNNGILLKPGSFRGFSRLKMEQQIERLETQYKNYSQHSLYELSLEINSVQTGGQFIEKANSIYIPKIGRSPVYDSLQDTTLKHQNYFQVVLKEDVNNAYVSAFFKSTLGRLTLSSSFSNTFISHLNKCDVEQILVALPKPEEQAMIVNTANSILRLKFALDEFDSELALNPKNSSSIQTQLDSMLEAIGGLTDVEKVNALVRQGESKNAEYKSTLSVDLKKHTREKYIETEALKTVVAFINSEGGSLLIGISDDGVILGINQEIEKFFKNNDKFLLHLKNALKSRIGEQFYPFIDYRLIGINDKKVLWVECKRSLKTPCYLDGSDFYVRTNPATDKLEGPKLVEYVKNHFT